MATLPATPRATRSSVLGKRAHQSQAEDASPSSFESEEPSFDEFVDAACLSPESSPCSKRPRTSLTLTDRHGNKENIPPFRIEVLGDSPRALRRTSTEFMTPTRPRTTPRRHASMSGVFPNTPATSMSLLSLQTPPTTPSPSVPLHSRARALLRSTCNSTADIAGRTAERAIILDFVTSFVESTASQPNPVLYISGSPGCGKTALVNSILTALEVKMFENEVNVAMVNCMALNGLDAVWDRLLEELGGGKKRGSKSRNNELVEELLSHRKSKCVLVLDEIDHVAASSQSLISLFALAQTHSSVLRIVGIANTHTLTSSAHKLSLHGVTGVCTVHFSPYTPEQLLDILTTRLQSLSSPSSPTVYSAADVSKFLPKPTLTLLSKKIAAQTGDVRALFEVLRAAIDRAIAQAFVDGKPNGTASPVTPTHILAALKAYAPASNIGAAALTPGVPALGKTSGNSETIAKIRNLGLHARLTLLALLIACKRIEAGLSVSSSSTPSPPRSPVKRGSTSPASPVKRSNSQPTTGSSQPSVDTTHLHTFYTTILANAFTPVSRSEFGDLAGVLETVGLVSLSSLSASGASKGRKLARTTSFGGGKNQAQNVMFTEGVRADEVLRGLGISAEADQASAKEAVDVREEQAAAIWDRELSKIKKEAKQLNNSQARNGAVGFDGAEED